MLGICDNQAHQIPHEKMSRHGGYAAGCRNWRPVPAPAPSPLQVSAEQPGHFTTVVGTDKIVHSGAPAPATAPPSGLAKCVHCGADRFEHSGMAQYCPNPRTTTFTPEPPAPATPAVQSSVAKFGQGTSKRNCGNLSAETVNVEDMPHQTPALPDQNFRPADSPVGAPELGTCNWDEDGKIPHEKDSHAEVFCDRWKPVGAPPAGTQPPAKGGIPMHYFLSESIAKVFSGNCTGMDDHDEPYCGKCAAMQAEIAKILDAWWIKWRESVSAGTLGAPASPTLRDWVCFDCGISYDKHTEQSKHHAFRYSSKQEAK